MQWCRSGLVSWPSAAVWPALLAKVRTVARTGLPARIVLCMEQDTKAEEQLQSGQGVQWLCSISRGQTPLVDPGAFSRGPLRRRNLRARHAFQIYLIENQAARDRAPVDMSRLADEIDQWCSRSLIRCELKAVSEPTEASEPMSISVTGGCMLGW